MRNFVIASLAAAILVTLFALPIFAADKGGASWPQYRGPNRDGVSTEKGWLDPWPAEGLKKLWGASVGVGYSSVSVADGKAFTMGHDKGNDIVFCFDAATGKEVWKYPYPCQAKGGGYPGPRSTPTVDGKFVYCLSSEGRLVCLEAEGGTLVWGKFLPKDFKLNPPGWGFACSPLVVGGQLVLDVGPVIAFDKKTGKGAWKSNDYKCGYSSPVAFASGSETLIAAFTGSGPVVVKGDGKEVAAAKWSTSYDVNAATPIVEGGVLFISSGYGTGCAAYKLEGGKLQEQWRNKSMCNHFNSCVLYEGHLYGVNEAELACLDFKTGKVKWTAKGFGKGSVTVADGKLIVLSDRGELAVAPASPEKFGPVSRAKALSGGTCWTVPVLAGGKIYCRNHEGELVCLDAAGK